MIMQDCEGSVEVTGLHELIHGGHIRTRLFVPLTSPRVQGSGSRRIFGLQLGVQKFLEQLVVAVVGWFPTKGDDKEARAHCLAQETGTIFVPEKRVRQIHIELIDDRCCLQEFHHLWGLLVEDLFYEKISNYLIRSGKASHERRRIVRVVLQRQRS